MDEEIETSEKQLNEIMDEEIETPEKQLNETSDEEIETSEKQLNETRDEEIETPEKQLNETRDEEIETSVKQFNEIIDEEIETSVKQENETSTLFNSNQYIDPLELKEEFTRDEKDLFDISHKETKIQENNELDMDEKNIYIHDKKTNNKKKDYVQEEKDKDEERYLKELSEVQNKEIPEKKQDDNVKNIHITENSYSRNNKKLSFF
jgi:hypothetical protein